MQKPNTFNEELAKFLIEPTRDKFRDLMQAHHGELSNFEFKSIWPDDSTLVKSILGFGNSGGGCMVVGVSEKENGSIVPEGVEAIRDKAKVDNAIRRYIPQNLMDVCAFMDFTYQGSEYGPIAGKSFQVVIVPKVPMNMPYLALAETTGIKKTVFYVRRHASTDEATHEEIQKIIDARLSTGHRSVDTNDLERHLEQLRELQSQFVHYKLSGMDNVSHLVYFGESAFHQVDGQIRQREGYLDFLKRMIATKQDKIEELLD